MKKTIKLFIASIVLAPALLLSTTGAAFAADCPDPYETKTVNGTEVRSLKPTSGFVGDDGCAISIEDYDKVRKEDSRVKWERIIPLAIIVLGVPAFIIYKKKRKK